MTTMTSTRFTLTVPRAMNDGTPVLPQDRAEIESRLLALFGGFTVHSAAGAWQGETAAYRETVGVYLLDCAGAGPDVDFRRVALMTVAKYVKVLLQQESVYVTESQLDRSFI